MGHRGGAVTISGVKQEIRSMYRQYGKKRNKIKRAAVNVKEDLIKRARDNAPYREGELADSIDGKVVDRGVGRGFFIIVSAGDKIYVRRMHESHYQAYPAGQAEHRRSKKTGFSYWKYNRRYRTAGGFWIDSRGNKHGRKYLFRARDEHLPRYKKMLESAGDRR